MGVAFWGKHYLTIKLSSNLLQGWEYKEPKRSWIPLIKPYQRKI